MSATIEDIRKAKKVAESEINLIVKKFVEEYNLEGVTVDVSIQVNYFEYISVPIVISVETEINVQI